MADQHDFELFTGPAPSEKGEMSDEQFREEMARTQAAIKQLQKEEGTSRTNDFKLASIIINFLVQPGNTDLFLLISRSVAQNIPSELIIAILSLIDKKSQEEVKEFLEADKKSGHSKLTALAIRQKADFPSLSPALKKTIDKWIENISTVSTKKPHRVLETIVYPGPQRELSTVVVQLSAFILRNFLKMHSVEIEFRDLRDFMQTVFLEIVRNLETLLQEQKQLT